MENTDSVKKETSNNKTSSRVDRTKKDLRRGLHELLKTENFDKISVKEICEHTSVNKMTFYHHYQDKYDLLDDCVREIGEEIYAKCQKNLPIEKREKAIVPLAAEVSTEVVEQCFNYQEEINNIVASSTSLGPFILQTSVEHLVELLMQEVEKLVTFKYPTEDIAAFLVGGYSYLIPKLMKRGREPREKTKDTFTHIYSDIINAMVIRKNAGEKVKA